MGSRKWHMEIGQSNNKTTGDLHASHGHHLHQMSEALRILLCLYQDTWRNASLWVFAMPKLHSRGVQSARLKSMACPMLNTSKMCPPLDFIVTGQEENEFRMGLCTLNEWLDEVFSRAENDVADDWASSVLGVWKARGPESKFQRKCCNSGDWRRAGGPAVAADASNLGRGCGARRSSEWPCLWDAATVQQLSSRAVLCWRTRSWRSRRVRLFWCWEERGGLVGRLFELWRRPLQPFRSL